jgi:hypothetical protein
MTKHVSLLQVAPLALLSLRRTGRCTFAIPEEVFDMDGPGHYFRRIKSVALSIPCVSGPYASVNCTATLLKSGIRKTPVLRDGAYARVDSEDDRFDDYFGSLQSVVTSSAQGDSGMFETNLRDERYLPFEAAGAVSEWQLELPGSPANKDPMQFDYETITDVIVHIQYTAREGGTLLRQGAMKNLRALVEEAAAAGCVRLFSVRQEFPVEWAKFEAEAADANGPSNGGGRVGLLLALREEHYPFWSAGRLGNVTRIDIIASTASAVPTIDVYAGPDSDTKTATLTSMPDENLFRGKLNTNELPANPVGTVKLFFADLAIRDLWIAVAWGGGT